MRRNATTLQDQGTDVGPKRREVRGSDTSGHIFIGIFFLCGAVGLDVTTKMSMEFASLHHSKFPGYSAPSSMPKPERSVPKMKKVLVSVCVKCDS